MKLAVIAKVRNGLMVKFRLNRGLSQPEAAEMAGICSGRWWSAENMRFDETSRETIL